MSTRSPTPRGWSPPLSSRSACCSCRLFRPGCQIPSSGSPKAPGAWLAYRFIALALFWSFPIVRHYLGDGELLLRTFRITVASRSWKGINAPLPLLYPRIGYVFHVPCFEDLTRIANGSGSHISSKARGAPRQGDGARIGWSEYQANREQHGDSLIARRTDFWWTLKRPDERVLWSGTGSRALLRPLPRRVGSKARSPDIFPASGWPATLSSLPGPSPAVPLVDTQVLKDKAINEGGNPLPLRYVRLRFPSGK